MKKKTVNGFDNIFEAVFNAIIKTKNYHLVIDSKETTELLTFFLQHILDINNYHILYKHSFIPAANKSVFITKAQYAQSKYKSMINATQLDLKENLYETVRLGYVGLAHKVEGFTKAVRRSNELIKKAYEIELDYDVVEYIKRFVGVDFLNPIEIRSLNKIRIISNAVKHNSGYAQKPEREKDDLKKYISYLDTGDKINIEPELFLLDIQSTIQYFNTVNLVVNALTAFSLLDDPENLADDIKMKKQVMIDHFKKMVGLYTESNLSERGESNTQGY